MQTLSAALSGLTIFPRKIFRCAADDHLSRPRFSFREADLRPEIEMYNFCVAFVLRAANFAGGDFLSSGEGARCRSTNLNY